MRSTERQTLHTESNQEKMIQFKNHFEKLENEISKHIVGQEIIIKRVLFCIFSGGHALLEGMPGLGKTTLIKAIARAIGLGNKRIQFTPDLMPADITGTNLINQNPDGSLQMDFNPGPIFTSLCLADEINRGTPKTQSAMLEAMQEGRVTISGKTHRLPDSFCVLATQNPIDLDGTYPLPEAQLDRFFLKIKVPSPNLEELIQISDLTSGGSKPPIERIITEEEMLNYRSNIAYILIPDYLKRYAARIILATNPNEETATPLVKQYVKFGSSPRGLLALILASKVNAATKGENSINEEDLQEVIFATLRHRLILNFEGEAKGIDQDDIIKEILDSIEVIPDNQLK